MPDTSARVAAPASPETVISERALAALTPGALGDGPCAHLVVDDFLRPEIAARALDEVERFGGRWRHRRHHGQSKRVFTDHARMPVVVRDIIDALNGGEFRRCVEVAGGVSGLLSDPGLEGAGLCEMRPGDFMRPHRDSLSHVTRPRWQRRHALFIFLNPDWREEYGGSLTLWDGDARGRGGAVRILPLFNRFVIFGDPAGVVHGVPDEIRCPAGTARRSIAAYYYTEHAEALPLRPTAYETPAMPGLASVNQLLVWFYFALRRRLGTLR
jgi:hypothetical protein